MLSLFSFIEMERVKFAQQHFLNFITNLVFIIIKDHCYTFLTFPAPFEYNSAHVVQTNLK
jgi:hypothetical protein